MSPSQAASRLLPLLRSPDLATFARRAWTSQAASRLLPLLRGVRTGPAAHGSANAISSGTSPPTVSATYCFPSCR